MCTVFEAPKNLDEPYRIRAMWDWARAETAARTGVSLFDVKFISSESIQLSSSTALDVPEAGLDWPETEDLGDVEAGLAVMTSGLRFVFKAAGRRFVYHANGSRAAFAGSERDISGLARKPAPSDRSVE
jgi:hypothetical protein